MVRSCSCAVYDVASRVGQLVGELAGVELPLLAAAVEQPDVVVAVELEVPVGVGGEPVVVAAVEHDGVVVGDAALGQQRLELLLVDEVAADLVLQVGGPVELDGAPDVALVVGRGVLVDLDQDDLRVVEVVLDPLGGDERVLAAHGFSFRFRCCRSSGCRGAALSACALRPPDRRVDQQVHLAAQAEAEDGVEQGGDQREPGGDERRRWWRRPGSRPAPRRRTPGRRPGRTAAARRPRARPAGRAGAGPASGTAMREACAGRRVRLRPRTAPPARRAARSQRAGGEQQHRREHDRGHGGREPRAAWVDLWHRRLLSWLGLGRPDGARCAATGRSSTTHARR